VAHTDQFTVGVDAHSVLDARLPLGTVPVVLAVVIIQCLMTRRQS
jgi:hypothetical protein